MGCIQPAICMGQRVVAALDCLPAYSPLNCMSTWIVSFSVLLFSKVKELPNMFPFLNIIIAEVLIGWALSRGEASLETDEISPSFLQAPHPAAPSPASKTLSDTNPMWAFIKLQVPFSSSGLLRKETSFSLVVGGETRSSHYKWRLRRFKLVIRKKYINSAVLLCREAARGLCSLCVLEPLETSTKPAILLAIVAIVGNSLTSHNHFPRTFLFFPFDCVIMLWKLGWLTGAFCRTSMCVLTLLWYKCRFFCLWMKWQC